MPFKQLSDSYETVKRKMNNWVVELGFSMDSKEIGCLLHPYFIDFRQWIKLHSIINGLIVVICE
jgi:hypothetical protein